MDILEKIIKHKVLEVAERKSLFPTKLLEKSIYFDGAPVSLIKYLLREDKTGVIAEFKRKSPSKGLINKHAEVEKTTIGYMQAGASALSILTDSEFFGGKNEDLAVARKFNFCPILRKDFIVDEYQIIEAKSIGADAILLIASALEPKKLLALAQFAKTLGLEVLMEVHNKEELESNLNPHLDVVGVNNRNLKTFETSIETSKALAGLIPEEFIKISESGISDPDTIIELRNYGFKGFLLGESFMKHARPDLAATTFMEQLNRLKAES
jgi:indole-3-glycerol phosphate synthase